MDELANTLTDVIEFELKGKTLKIKKITLGILAEFSQRMFEQRLKSALAAIKDELTPTEVAAVVDELSRRRSGESELMAINSLDGMRLILRLCAEAGGTPTEDLNVIDEIKPSDIPLIESLLNMATDTEASELVKSE